MRNKIKRYLALAVMVMGLACSTAMTAFAYTDEQGQQNGVGTETVGTPGVATAGTGITGNVQGNSEAVIAEEPAAGETSPGGDSSGGQTAPGNVSTAGEASPGNVSSTEDTQPDNGDAPFSVPGNGQLVDDKSGDGTKQFLTVQTKNGNTFFLVLDRSNNMENVYMLSMIDENDLAEFLEETEKESEKKTPSIILPETETKPEVKEPEKEVKEEKAGGTNTGTLFVVIVLLAGGAVGYYYFKVLKPKREEEEAESENMEIYDDGVYINEDEDPEDTDEYEE